MDNKPQNIKITELFSDGSIYSIPIYQRDYAWGFDEVQQLITDIDTISDQSDDYKYYIGTLVTYKREEDGKYEVIDGQQRLTTLYILFCNLVKKKKEYITVINEGTDDEEYPLGFDCRENSNICLKVLCNPTDEDNKDTIDFKSRIIDNANSISKIFEKKDDVFVDEFLKKLEKVYIFRVEVPRHTDMNHYFEIMNTRGEQLEHTDIIKARLMAPLDREDHNIFSQIWNACSDMGHYVQIGISDEKKNREKSLRNIIFDEYLNKITVNNWDDINPSKKDTSGHDESKDVNPEYTEEQGKTTQNSMELNDEEKESSNDDENNQSLKRFKTITSAIEASVNEIEPPKPDENEQFVETGYNSIISFQYFLLHAFRIFAESECADKKLNTSLNDRLLIDDFNAIFGQQVDKEDAKKFIIFLLNLRFLFDKYIIKRYYSEKNKNGVWTLRSYERNKNDKLTYKNTFSRGESTSEDDDSPDGEKCKMLQSCLRVSFTSPRTMHWITHTLDWLYKKQINGLEISCDDLNKSLINYIKYGKMFDDINPSKSTEDDDSIAKDEGSVNIKGFLDEGNFKQGVGTPNLIFNFLDYCIWENYKGSTESPYKDIDIANFKFEFRNSVEHYYPRNPHKSDLLEEWTSVDEHERKDVDQFGNLALLQRNINAKFSNMSPEHKKKYIKEEYKGTMSLKLQIMAESTKNNNAWKDEDCVKHGKKMLNILREACGLPQE